MIRQRASLSPLVVVVLLAGCATSRPFYPRGPVEKRLFDVAVSDVFPDDVRADIERFSSTLLLWTGIIQRSYREGGSIQIRIEHHYWDWIEDYGAQREIAFLSPRGEGLVHIALGAQDLSGLRVGKMAIFYGYPERVAPDNTILMRCEFIKTLPEDLYTVERWDYGRVPCQTR